MVCGNNELFHQHIFYPILIIFPLYSNWPSRPRDLILYTRIAGWTLAIPQRQEVLEVQSVPFLDRSYLFCVRYFVQRGEWGNKNMKYKIQQIQLYLAFNCYFEILFRIFFKTWFQFKLGLHVCIESSVVRDTNGVYIKTKERHLWHEDG